MTDASEQYVRCPECRMPNLSGSGICDHCGSNLEEELADELRRVASDTWYEIKHLGMAAGIGLLLGLTAVAAAALISRGAWLASIGESLIPPSRPGERYFGPMLLAVVPIFWMVAGPKIEASQLGGKVELFDPEEVQAGAWACGLMTLILAAVSFFYFTGSGGRSPGGDFSRLAPMALWTFMPLICQSIAIAGGVKASRRLYAREN